MNTEVMNSFEIVIEGDKVTSVQHEAEYLGLMYSIETTLNEGEKFSKFTVYYEDSEVSKVFKLGKKVGSLEENDYLVEALKYAYDLLDECAEKGNYPTKALKKNGGEGFTPIVNALKKVKK